MFGSGVGWYTDAVTGQSLPYLISSGLPTYSLEYKSRASASQPPPGPHRSGDGSGVRTSGSAPASTATISGNKRPVPETSGSAEVLPDPLEQSHPDGCENLSLLSQVASGDDGQRRVGTAHPLHLICEPPSSDGGLDGDQRTQVGSPLRGPATGRVESCDSDGVARSEYTNSRSLVPFVDLSQLSPAGLAQHLAGVAFEDDPPPSVSPRLGVVLHVPSIHQHRGRIELPRASPPLVRPPRQWASRPAAADRYSAGLAACLSLATSLELPRASPPLVRPPRWWA